MLVNNLIYFRGVMTGIPSNTGRFYYGSHEEPKHPENGAAKKSKKSKAKSEGGYLEGIGSKEAFVTDKDKLRSDVSKKPKYSISKEKLPKSSSPDLSEEHSPSVIGYLSGVTGAEGTTSGELGSSDDYLDARSESPEEMYNELTEFAEGDLVVNEAKKLGRGGFASVFSGKVKIPDASKDEGYVEKNVAVKAFDSRLERELFVIDQMIRSKVEGIVRLYGKLTSESKSGYSVHLVMKHCNNGPVSNYFQQHAGDVKGSYQMLLTLMRKVEAFHKAGFCHRDIHEANFLVHKRKNGDREVFLTDFGHAMQLGRTGIFAIPLEGRGLHGVNSPPIFTKLYAQALTQNKEHLLESAAYQQYESYAYEKGVELDNYQIGMMMFRVCVGETEQRSVGSGEPADSLLSDKISTLWDDIDKKTAKLPASVLKEEKDRLRLKLFVEGMTGYFSSSFSQIPIALARIIIGLLAFPYSTPLPMAIKKWQERIS